MTEHLIFIHGVNTREERDQPDYANQLTNNIQSLCSHEITIKSTPLYWGNVNITAEQALLEDLKQTSVWNELAFQGFRAHQMLQFIGDGALYISRAGGRLIVERLIQQVMDGLREFNPATDHIHLISHSMGTVILFDMLFSSRWDAANAGGYAGVEELRNMIFHGGSPVRSIHTMGSPISLFTLTMLHDGPVPNTHDITPRLGQYLKELCRNIQSFPWRNYLHAMDIVASPIERLIPKMLNAVDSCLDVKDILTESPSLLNKASDIVLDIMGTNKLSADVLRLALFAGSAHSSYWTSLAVASTIAQTIEAVARQPQRQLV
jgi:hypothetical protein